MVDGKQAGDGVAGSASNTDGSQDIGHWRFSRAFVYSVLVLSMAFLVWMLVMVQIGFNQSSEARKAREAQRQAVLSLSGTELAGELRDVDYEISGVLPGGNSESYVMVFSALDWHGTCSMEAGTMVACEWFSRG